MIYVGPDSEAIKMVSIYTCIYIHGYTHISETRWVFVPKDAQKHKPCTQAQRAICRTNGGVVFSADMIGKREPFLALHLTPIWLFRLAS